MVGIWRRTRQRTSPFVTLQQLQKSEMANFEAESGWESWGGYMKSKRRKLEYQFDENEGDVTVSNIFDGISIFVDGYTEPSADVLKRLMKAHGGRFNTYQSESVTHVIASSLAHAKIQKIGKKVRVVSAKWITDSISVGRLLPDYEYILFSEEKNSGCQRLDKFVSRLETVEQLGGKESVSADQPSTSKAVVLSTAPMISAKDPNFLKDFYSRSRLHFISTLAQEMKDFVKELRSESEPIFPGRERIFQVLVGAGRDSSSWNGEKVFMHLDLDCFFVSVAIRNKQELHGRPVVVTHSKGKGPSDQKHDSGGEPFASSSEIASCSYEARKSGIKNGMFLGEALKLCPNLVPVPYDFEGYHAVSMLMYRTVASYTLKLEAVSCDEMFVDLTELCEETGAGPLEIAMIIREDIFEKSQCPASAGLGPNMLVARLATRRAKPNGQFYVSKSAVSDFMREVKVDDLPGVGFWTSEKLATLGVKSCANLQETPLHVLCKEFGPKHGKQLQQSAFGEDKRLFKEDIVRKSVSCDVNYGIRFTEESEAHAFIQRLSEEVSVRLQKAEVVGKSVTLKVLVRNAEAPLNPKKFMGCGLCDSYTRSSSLPVATGDKAVISRECLSLLRQINPKISDLRGIGISMHKLESCGGNNADGKKEPSNGGILQFLRTKSSEKLPVEKQSFEKHRSDQNLLSTDLADHCHPASLSQVDPEVFKALPPDLQNEIQGRLVGDSRKEHRFDEPVADGEASVNPILLPDKETLDVEVLKDLPYNIRQELEEAYKKNEQEVRQVGNKSPSKGKRKQLVALTSPIKNTLSKIWSPEKELENKDDDSNNKKITVCHGEPDEAKLFGERSYDGVKELLRQKVIQEESLSAEDTTTVCKYFEFIIMKKHQLSAAQRLLRGLHRFIKRKDSISWRGTYETISKVCQRAAVSEYGSKMFDVPRFHARK